MQPNSAFGGDLDAEELLDTREESWLAALSMPDRGAVHESGHAIRAKISGVRIQKLTIGYCIPTSSETLDLDSLLEYFLAGRAAEAILVLRTKLTFPVRKAALLSMLSVPSDGVVSTMCLWFLACCLRGYPDASRDDLILRANLSLCSRHQLLRSPQNLKAIHRLSMSAQRAAAVGAFGYRYRWFDRRNTLIS